MRKPPSIREKSNETFKRILLKKRKWIDDCGMWKDPLTGKEWLFDNAVEIQTNRDDERKWKYE